MLIGYARVSTQDQNIELQQEALTKAGCQKVFEDKMSGTRMRSPTLYGLTASGHQQNPRISAFKAGVALLCTAHCDKFIDVMLFAVRSHSMSAMLDRLTRRLRLQPRR